MSGEVEVMKGSVWPAFISNLVSRSLSTYQSIIPNVPKFTASHVIVIVPGHCSPDSSSDPTLEVRIG